MNVLMCIHLPGFLFYCGHWVSGLIDKVRVKQFVEKEVNIWGQPNGAVPY